MARRGRSTVTRVVIRAVTAVGMVAEGAVMGAAEEAETSRRLSATLAV